MSWPGALVGDCRGSGEDGGSDLAESGVTGLRGSDGVSDGCLDDVEVDDDVDEP